MYIMWNILAKRRIFKISEVLKVSSNFDIYSFTQISRNFGVLQVENVLDFEKKTIYTLKNFSIACIILSAA